MSSMRGRNNYIWKQSMQCILFAFSFSFLFRSRIDSKGKWRVVRERTLGRKVQSKYVSSEAYTKQSSLYLVYLVFSFIQLYVLNQIVLRLYISMNALTVPTFYSQNTVDYFLIFLDCKHLNSLHMFEDLLQLELGIGLWPTSSNHVTYFTVSAEGKDAGASRNSF